MTYYESFSIAETEHDLKILMKESARVAVMFGNNPDRIKAIEDAGNRVAHERGWDSHE